ncbi:hypothetical protein SASPL_112682 [Salvia splendens]|uniref:HD-ZIP protein N-terminal domain-containing protein n=1 Tax=Salvia splendens TaxID=180675 RepID=A0A8X8YEQ1_SALSN|nr:hypothetical protein SASPL_112682 [Salvia splendens]
MMVQKDQELGLSLSLSYPPQKRADVSTASPLHLNLMPSSSSPSPFTINTNTNSWTQAFTSSDRRGEETRSFLKGIDVNCLPETAEEAAAEEEEGGVSSPNSTISSLSGKRSEREDHDGFSRGISDEEDAENARKKLRLSKDQSAVLEESFKEHSTLNPVKAKNGSGEEIRAQAEADRSLVSKQKSKDEIEANRGGLRISKEMLREFDRGKQEAAEGGARAAIAEALSAALHANDATNNSHNVPFLRESGAALRRRSHRRRSAAADSVQSVAGCPSLQAFRCYAI